jgi:class 3 adenylate cyclase
MINIGKKMKESALPGSVYMTAATQALAANNIDCEGLEPISVKGVSESVSVFRLRRMKSIEESVAKAKPT